MDTRPAEKLDMLGIVSVCCAGASALLLFLPYTWLIAVPLAAIGGFLGSVGVCKGRSLGIFGSVVCLMIMGLSAYLLFHIWDLQVKLNELLKVGIDLR